MSPIARSTTSRNWWVRASVLLIVGLALMVAGAVSSSSSSTANAEPPNPDLQRSSELADGPDVAAADAFDYSATSSSAEQAAQEMAVEVPVPDGGNFNGIRWDELGGVSRADIQGLLSFNAACQWLRADEDGREQEVARAILAEVSRWPTMRGGDRNAFARLLAKDNESAMAASVRRDCREMHKREVSYAKARGLVPSS